MSQDFDPNEQPTHSVQSGQCNRSKECGMVEFHWENGWQDRCWCLWHPDHGDRSIESFYKLYNRASKNIWSNHGERTAQQHKVAWTNSVGHHVTEAPAPIAEEFAHIDRGLWRPLWMHHPKSSIDLLISDSNDNRKGSRLPPGWMVIQWAGVQTMTTLFGNIGSSGGSWITTFFTSHPML